MIGLLRICVHNSRLVICTFALQAALFVSDALAQAPGATLQKCTCHMDESGPPERDGATAANATLCIQMLDKGHKWCEITVACLRGNLGPQCHASSGPKEALLELYDFSAKEILQADGPQLATFGPVLARDKNAVAQLIQKNASPIDNCVRSYLNRGDDTRLTGLQMLCSFDHQSGWLAILFDAGDQLVRFSFGPRE